MCRGVGGFSLSTEQGFGFAITVQPLRRPGGASDPGSAFVPLFSGVVNDEDLIN